MMRINLTENLHVDSDDIARIIQTPFDETVSRIKTKSRRDAARKYAKSHRMVLTLQTLPDDIYARIPKANSLWVVTNTGTVDDIDLKLPESSMLPKILGLIDNGSPSFSQHGHKAIVKLQDVIDCYPKAKKEWEAAEPIKKRGQEVYDLIVAYLDDAMFTTPTQLAWSAPELTAALIHIAGVRKGYGRRYDAKQIFLARLDNRRYVDRTKMRRPKLVKPMPDTLTPYLGEAKLLHTALHK